MYIYRGVPANKLEVWGLYSMPDVKGKKKPDSSRPYLCFLAEHMNVPPY